MRLCISCTRPRASVVVGAYLVDSPCGEDDEDAVGDNVDVVEGVDDLGMMM